MIVFVPVKFPFFGVKVIVPSPIATFSPYVTVKLSFTLIATLFNVAAVTGGWMLYPVYVWLPTDATSLEASAASMVNVMLASVLDVNVPSVPVITIVAVPALTLFVRDLILYSVGLITLPSTTTSKSGLIAAPV